MILFFRLLQGVETRAAARDVAIGLPNVPPSCLALLRMLVHTGTRAVAQAQGVSLTRTVLTPSLR